MALEIIKSIVEAEKQVALVKTKAQADAEVIKKEAILKTAEIAAEAKKQAKKEEKELVQKAITNSQSEVEKILAEAQEKCNAIFRAAELKKPNAITAVLGKVVGKYVDS